MVTFGDVVEFRSDVSQNQDGHIVPVKVMCKWMDDMHLLGIKSATRSPPRDVFGISPL